MKIENVGNELAAIIEDNVAAETKAWLDEKKEAICKGRSVKDLYLTYSLIASKFSKEVAAIPKNDSNLKQYLLTQKATLQQIARVYLLVGVLEYDNAFFASKVANIIEVADTSELETFLKFLVLLPDPENYKSTAVDALRTNISTVFSAIAHNNPYPSLYFDEKQWNQMYLKTAFMEGNLEAILDIDKRANQDLARIISDYAHERWAASREIDPTFWRPVAGFLDDQLLKDIERLLKSANPIENRAGALCCYASKYQKAKDLLKQFTVLKDQVENKLISWENLKVVHNYGG